MRVRKRLKARASPCYNDRVARNALNTAARLTSRAGRADVQRVMKDIAKAARELERQKSDATHLWRYYSKLELLSHGIRDLRSMGLGFYTTQGDKLMATTKKAAKKEAAGAAKKKTAKKNADAKNTAKKAERNGVNVGRTTGLKLGEAFKHIFEWNEKQKRSKKWTDDQIAEWIQQEFPGRESRSMTNISGVRRAMVRRGEVISNRYDENGSVTWDCEEYQDKRKGKTANKNAGRAPENKDKGSSKKDKDAGASSKKKTAKKRTVQ